MVTSISDAIAHYLQGKSKSLNDVMNLIKDLVNFYSLYIAREDKKFSYPCLEYLAKQEQNVMLEEFWELDRKLIHEKYQRLVEEAETNNT